MKPLLPEPHPPRVTRLALAVVLVVVLASSLATTISACERASESEGGEAAARRPAAELLGDRPALPNEVGGTLGSPRASFAAFDGGDDTLDSPTWTGVRYRLERRRGSTAVDALSIEFTALEEPLPETVEAAWGAPGPGGHWFDTDARLRATVHPDDGDRPVRLVLRHYQPLEDLFTPDGRLEAEPAAGWLDLERAAVEQVSVFVPGDLDEGALLLPPTELDDDAIALRPLYRSERVVELRLDLTVDGEASAALDQTLERHFGPPEPARTLTASGQLWVVPETARRIFVGESLDGDHRSIAIERYLPLDVLLGSPEAPGFSFEQDHGGASWLGTLDETAFAALRTPGKEWLELPPTRWDRGPTWVRVEFVDGVASAIRFALGYDLQRSGRDAILGAFRARFGEPSEGKAAVGDGKAYHFPGPPAVTLAEPLAGEKWEVRATLPESADE